MSRSQYLWRTTADASLFWDQCNTSTLFGCPACELQEEKMPGLVGMVRQSGQHKREQCHCFEIAAPKNICDLLNHVMKKRITCRLHNQIWSYFVHAAWMLSKKDGYNQAYLVKKFLYSVAWTHDELSM